MNPTSRETDQNTRPAGSQGKIGNGGKERTGASRFGTLIKTICEMNGLGLAKKCGVFHLPHCFNQLASSLDVLADAVRGELDTRFHRRMAVKDKLDNLIRTLVRQVQLRQLLHTGNKSQRIARCVERV